MKTIQRASVLVFLTLSAVSLFGQASTRRQDLMGTPVTFTTNVPGVTIFINSVEYRGAFPQTINFQPGTYALVARAQGYREFTTTFTVVQNRAMTVSIVMQPDRPATVDITFTSNAPNTILTFANSRLTRPLPQTVSAAPGTYSITAEAPGFQPLNTTVTVTANTTIPLTLTPANVDITFTSNAPNTILTFANSRLSRPLPQTVTAAPGTYTITAEAPGFQPLSTTVTVTGSTTIPLTLQAALVPVQIVSDIRAIQVTVNGQRLRGNLPQSISLPLGPATITASAPGFQEQTLTVEITGPQTVNLVLIPLLSTVRVTSNVIVFVDGIQQNAETFTVEPGRRMVRIISGNLSVEQPFNFVAGRTYELVPNLSFSIR